MWAAITRPVDKRALLPAFMVVAATALQEQKLKVACTPVDLVLVRFSAKEHL